jgi:hypothetical protein
MSANPVGFSKAEKIGSTKPTLYSNVVKRNSAGTLSGMSEILTFPGSKTAFLTNFVDPLRYKRLEKLHLFYRVNTVYAFLPLFVISKIAVEGGEGSRKPSLSQWHGQRACSRYTGLLNSRSSLSRTSTVSRFYDN